MKTQPLDEKSWITHRYFRTYAIASQVHAIATNPAAFMRELEELWLDGGVLSFVSKWSNDTVVHKFARWVADDMFYEDTSGPYIEVMEGDNYKSIKRRLPVDVCLRAYGIANEPFEIPPSDGTSVKVERNIAVRQESSRVADACHAYFIEDLRCTQAYENLLTQIGAEVFHVMFTNRAAMAGLNRLVAAQLQNIDPDGVREDPDLRSLLMVSGSTVRPKRTPIPKWVRNAVFFRDHGRCVYCGRDLTALIDSQPARHFDHIVPLARGGINDVTNLQLLCETCNTKKSDIPVEPSNKYRRWINDSPSGM